MTGTGLLTFAAIGPDGEHHRLATLSDHHRTSGASARPVVTLIHKLAGRPR